MKKICCAITVLLVIAFNVVQAQYPTIYNFTGYYRSSPQGALTLSANKLYGMAGGGGTYNDGYVFSVDTNGNGFKDLFDFDSATGWSSYGSVILAGKELYGMTNWGGVYNLGCIFEVDTNGRYRTLYSFNGTAGGNTTGSLILSGRTLYGMAYYGLNGVGCIFSMDTSGSNYKDIMDFNHTNGDLPEGELTLIGKKLFGMTFRGGANDSTGCIFSVDTNGAGYKVLFNFNGSSGYNPKGSLSYSGNFLYGTTSKGGANKYGTFFCIDTNGSSYRDLYDFNSNQESPSANIIISGKTAFFTSGWGRTGYGNVFSIDTDGSGYIDMYDFNLCVNGCVPATWGPLVLQGSTLFGMTMSGGAYSDGTIFKLSTNSTASTENIEKVYSNVTLYPNPNHGIFNLSISNEQLGMKNTVEIYNMLGERIKSEELRDKNTSINISDKSPGIYFYRIITTEGQQVATGKFVVE